MIGILHAYSRTNAGDGLLVDLTLERLRRAGIDASDCVLVALDPGSFTQPPRRVRAGTPTRGVSGDVVAAAGRGALLAGAAVSRRAVGEVARALEGCDAFVAVGGGYLRTGTATSSVGTLVNHVPQLAVAARSSTPAVYLPQSIGPLRGPVGRLVRRLLARVDVVCARDDRTVDELALAQVRRIPDLAVLDLAERLDSVHARTPGGSIALIARDLGDPSFDARVRAIGSALGDRLEWAVQAEGDETKSDAVFYDRIGVTGARASVDVLADPATSATVSVRLHGALMSLLQGVPAVHLSYERKGWAAYTDLGLGDYVFDARSADPAVVVRRANELAADAGAFWDAVRRARPGLLAASEELTAIVRSTVDPRAA